MAPIYPRISATLLEPRLARVSEKYGWTLEDVFRGKDHLRTKAVSQLSDDTVFEHAKDEIRRETELLRPLLSSTDATLVGAFETSRRKILYQIESLHGKYVRAAALKNELLERHLEAFSNSLYPDKKPQERLLNISSFIARYSLDIVPRLTKLLSLDSTEHQVVEL